MSRTRCVMTAKMVRNRIFHTYARATTEIYTILFVGSVGCV